MKFLKVIVFFFICFFGINNGFSQENKQAITKPSEGKSLVYITRSNGAMMINFRVYDKDLFIGALSYGEYFVYECEPGSHLFWAASENRDYVEATLEPNKVYVIDLGARMGAFVASVAVIPQSPTEKKHRKKFYKTVKNETAILKNQAKLSSDEKKENIAKALEKYNQLKESNSSKIQVLKPDMNFENADKPE